ncbi:MAG: YbaB/EbfC family nucleoid-associated protein [Planctomycetota bacterium]
MFGGLKNLAQMASLMSQAGDIQGKVTAAKERVARVEVSGTAGGDAISIRMTGDFRVTGVSIHPWLIESKDQELFEKLITEAANSAIQSAKESAAREMAMIAEGMNIPGLQEAMAKMGM